MKNWANALLVAATCLAAGCGAEMKHQEALRGRWTLESRRMADGTELTPPEAAGVLEWFPLSEHQAYATLVLSEGEGHVNFTGARYQLDGSTFVREEHSRLGDGYIKSAFSVDAIPSRTEGTYAFTEPVTLSHSDGTTFMYEADTLTVTHKDGTVDRWTRDVDQKGMLPN